MFFANYSVKELSALASVLDIPGRSKMNKEGLYNSISAVIDAAQDEALWEDEVRQNKNLPSGKFRIPRKLKKVLKKYGVL